MCIYTLSQLNRDKLSIESIYAIINYISSILLHRVSIIIIICKSYVSSIRIISTYGIVDNNEKKNTHRTL